MALSLYHRRGWQVALLLLAFALHIYRLDAQSLWYDEGVSATVAQLDLTQLTQWTANDIQPPLYYYLLAGWGRLAGWSEWSLRFPSAYFALLSAPLLAALAYKLTQSKPTSGAALWITACHPLLVYYGQEARMYAMLVALGVLTGYWLFSALHAPNRWHSWVGYIVCATLTIYTHYFAIFLLVALAFVQAILPYGARLGRFRGYLAANLCIVGLYLPWLWFMLARLTNDTSYWQGQFKWWEALRRIAIIFSLGETVLENEALPWLLFVALITLLALGRLLLHWSTPAARRLLLVALCWLLIPILTTLMLAVLTPKFNARYVLLALPGLILLWSGGLAMSSNQRLQEDDPITPSLSALNADSESVDASFQGAQSWVTRNRAPWKSTPYHLVTFLLLAPFSLGVINWFSDPAFTKAQWRELAGYVRSQIQPNERVVLVSGHAWPIWHYYAADLTPVRLPPIEILDVNSVLDYPTVATELSRQLSAKTGVWLINWQQEVVDPTAVTALALGLGGEEQPVDAQFWQLRLRHYQQLRPNVFRASLPPHTPVNATFGKHLLLKGYALLPNADLLLLWQATATSSPNDTDFWLSSELMTAQTIPLHRLADRRPAAYQFPTFRWPVGQPVIERLAARDWSGGGILAGTYNLQLGLYDPSGDRAGLDVVDEQGVALGKRVRIALTLPDAIPGPLPAVAEQWPSVTPALHLTVTLSPRAVEPNDRLLVYLDWYLSEPLRQPLVLQPGWQLGNAEGNQPMVPLPTVQIDPTLPENAYFRTVWQIPAPNLSPGVITYEVAARLPTQFPPPPPISVPITLLPSTRGSTLPADLSGPLSMVFAPPLGQSSRPFVGAIHLVGLVEPLPALLPVGSSLALTAVWQASADWDYPPVDYFVTLQLLGADGKPVVQDDQPLPRRTSTWIPNEVEVQPLSLRLPAKPGDYQILLAVYAPQEPGMPRLVTPAGADSLILGTLRVTP